MSVQAGGMAFTGQEAWPSQSMACLGLHIHSVGACGSTGSVHLSALMQPVSAACKLDFTYDT